MSEMSHVQARGSTRRKARCRRWVKARANKKFRIRSKQLVRMEGFDGCPNHSREVYDAAWRLY